MNEWNKTLWCLVYTLVHIMRSRVKYVSFLNWNNGGKGLLNCLNVRNCIFLLFTRSWIHSTFYSLDWTGSTINWRPINKSTNFEWTCSKPTKTDYINFDFYYCKQKCNGPCMMEVHMYLLLHPSLLKYEFSRAEILLVPLAVSFNLLKPWEIPCKKKKCAKHCSITGKNWVCHIHIYIWWKGYPNAMSYKLEWWISKQREWIFMDKLY